MAVHHKCIQRLYCSKPYIFFLSPFKSRRLSSLLLFQLFLLFSLHRNNLLPQLFASLQQQGSNISVSPGFESRSKFWMFKATQITFVLLAHLIHHGLSSTFSSPFAPYISVAEHKFPRETDCCRGYALGSFCAKGQLVPLAFDVILLTFDSLPANFSLMLRRHFCLKDMGLIISTL